MRSMFGSTAADAGTTIGSGAAIVDSAAIRATSGRAASSRTTPGVAVSAIAFTIHSEVTLLASRVGCLRRAARNPVWPTSALPCSASTRARRRSRGSAPRTVRGSTWSRRVTTTRTVSVGPSRVRSPARAGSTIAPDGAPPTAATIEGLPDAERPREATNVAAEMAATTRQRTSWRFIPATPRASRRGWVRGLARGWPGLAPDGSRQRPGQPRAGRRPAGRRLSGSARGVDWR